MLDFSDGRLGYASAAVHLPLSMRDLIRLAEYSEVLRTYVEGTDLKYSDTARFFRGLRQRFGENSFCPVSGSTSFSRLAFSEAI